MTPMLTKKQAKQMNKTKLCPDCDGKLKGGPLGPWNSQLVECLYCGSEFFASAHGVNRVANGKGSVSMKVEAGTKIRVWDAEKVVMREHVLNHFQSFGLENRVKAKRMFFKMLDGKRLYVEDLDAQGFAVFKTSNERWSYIIVKIP